MYMICVCMFDIIIIFLIVAMLLPFLQNEGISKIGNFTISSQVNTIMKAHLWRENNDTSVDWWI